MEPKRNTKKINDYFEDLMKIYLQPKKDPHVRIGKSYQATIPHNQLLTEIVRPVEESFTADGNQSDSEISKPNKKQKLDDN